jgi:glutaredoxin 3
MKATIYTKDNCTFCVQAKTLMKIRGIEWEELNMQKIPSMRTELMEKCEKINVLPRTVPQIWLDDTYVGGFQELKNKLDALPIDAI